MKAATQAISIVLIVAMVAGLVGVAYSWGVPIMQKRTTISDFSIAESFILQLDNKIKDIANTGAGQVTLDIPLGRLILIPITSNEPENNSLVLEFPTSQPMITSGFVPIDTINMGYVAGFGEAEPRMITLSGEAFQAGYIIYLNLTYRELDTDSTPRRGYVIVLNPPTSVTSGTSRVVVSFNGIETEPGGAYNGGDLIKTIIDIELA